MLKAFLSRVTSGLVVAVFLSSSLLHGEPSKAAPAAPVPAQIRTAHKVFISNVAFDSMNYLDRIGGANRSYDEFYAAMKNWGRYELVDSPADADLVFEIRFSNPFGGIRCVVSIFDTKTHFTLWTVAENMYGGNRKATLEKKFLEGLGKIMENLKRASGENIAPEKTTN